MKQSRARRCRRYPPFSDLAPSRVQQPSAGWTRYPVPNLLGKGVIMPLDRWSLDPTSIPKKQSIKRVGHPFACTHIYTVWSGFTIYSNSVSDGQRKLANQIYTVIVGRGAGLQPYPKFPGGLATYGPIRPSAWCLRSGYCPTRAPYTYSTANLSEPHQ